MSSIGTISDKIFEACTEGNLSVINKRINRKRNILFYNEYGQTPLIVATINNHNDIVQKICENDKKNYNIDVIDYDGYTALYYAVENNNCENVKTLLHYGANYSIPLYDSIFPMTLAVMMEYNKIVRILYDYGDLVPNNYLGLSIKRQKKEEPFKETTNELILSIKNNNINDVLECVNKGYNINAKFLPNGMTPIMYATQLGNLEIVKILHKKGADLKILDSIGGNSYLIAIVNKYQDIIDYFDSIT